MISLGQEEHLGYKAYIIFTFRRISGGVFLFIILLIALLFNKFILTSLIGFTSYIFPNYLNTSNIVTTILIDATLFLFWLSIFLIFLGFIIGWLEYRNYTYQFNEFDLIMKKGILDRKEFSLPYRQIQDIDTDRSFLYQIFHLSKLILKTAGSEETGEQKMTEINIEPIDKDICDEIQTMLERKIGVQVVEDQVKADKKDKKEEVK